MLHKYSHDYKVVIVGDAAMSPYEIVQPGGSVEHWNEEAGEAWLRRLRGTYEKSVSGLTRRPKTNGNIRNQSVLPINSWKGTCSPNPARSGRGHGLSL